MHTVCMCVEKLMYALYVCSTYKANKFCNELQHKEFYKKKHKEKKNTQKTYQILFQFGQFSMITLQSRLIPISFLQRNLTRFNFHLFQLK